jgi:pilus assembly protein CpaB
MGSSKSLIISLVLTAFAVLLVYTSMDQQKKTFTKDLGTMVSVLVANQNIPENTALEPSMFTTKEVPKLCLQPNAIFDMESIKDTLAAVPIAKDETLITTKLQFLGVKTGLAPVVSRGKRAMALTANAVNSVGRLIKPGDRIDIIASIVTTENGQQKIIVKTVLQDILVLSIGDYINAENKVFQPKGDFGQCAQVTRPGSDRQFGNITVEVTPKEAQLLVGFVGTGSSLSYSLRNPNDRDTQLITPTTSQEITGK